jgi:hypothetical protein
MKSALNCGDVQTLLLTASIAEGRIFYDLQPGHGLQLKTKIIVLKNILLRTASNCVEVE